ncbi:uncharacterized protein PAC_17669 [Phialocephala subalpina]|uniref:Uncharacterized protein n=1 Tax=Phialocephala subalpina TaxID=576137 RepID=A0A1L7XRW2_9HELO|nr:uncharacterized protein PAC_17669 [Phialocephala subalpina]
MPFNMTYAVPQQSFPPHMSFQQWPPTPSPNGPPLVSQQHAPPQNDFQRKPVLSKPPQDLISYERQTRGRACSKMKSAIHANDSEGIVQLLGKWKHGQGLLKAGLGYAIETGNLTLVRLFLKQGVKIGSNTIESAVQIRSIAIFELLFEYGWRPNDTYYTRDTYASRMVLPEVLASKDLTEWLLKKGADPNLGAPLWGDHSIDSPPRSNSPDALNRAALLANIDTFKLLLDHGAQIKNCCALHYAAASNMSPDECKAMMEYLEPNFPINGFDNARGPFGLGTPLHYAVRTEKIENIKWLLRRGADPFFQKGAKQSAYEEAVRLKYVAAVDLFDQWRREKLCKPGERRESI